MQGSALNRFIGGSPLGVAVKLLVLSFLVGVVLAAFHLSPLDLVDRILGWFQDFFGVGAEALRRIGGYLLLGAGVVIPVWFVSRLLSVGRRRG